MLNDKVWWPTLQSLESSFFQLSVLFTCSRILFALKSAPSFSRHALFIILFGEHFNIKIKIRLSIFHVVLHTRQYLAISYQNRQC